MENEIPSQSMALMRIFARLTPQERTTLLKVADAIAHHEKVWPDTSPTGAYETKASDFDSHS